MNEAIQIRLFGTMTLTRNSGRAELPLVSAQKLIALLCLKPGAELPRVEIARMLWDDSDDDASRNRLRTALVQARSALEPLDSIGGDKNHLIFDPAGITTDLWDAQQFYKRALGSADEIEEDQSYRKLLEVIQRPFLNGVDDLWAESERRKWRERGISARIRLSTLAEKWEDWQSAATVTENILDDFPYDERAWSILLRNYARQGRHIEIFERFAATRKKLKKELGGKFSPGLLSIAESIRMGGPFPSQLLPSQSEIAGRTLDRMILEKPEEALEFLGSTTFINEIMTNPADTRQMVDRVIEKTSGFEPARLRCLMAGLNAAYLHYDHKRTRELGEILLEHDTDPMRRRSVSTMIAFAYFQVRDWDMAYSRANMALEISRAVGNEPSAQYVLAQIASFDWHMGKLDEALEAYFKVMEATKHLTDRQATVSKAVLNGNISFVYVMKGDYATAEDYMQKSADIAALVNNSAIHSLALPILGAIRMHLGKVESGKEMLAQGMGVSYRQKDDRSFEIALDSAALGMSAIGKHEMSQALLQKAGELRAASGHTRSIAEDIFANRIRASNTTARPDPAFLALTSKRQMVVMILDAISG
jgi:DNA-binding SARP family transcriptional activator